MQNSKFYSPSKGLLSVSAMIDELSNFVDEEPSSFYRLVIGTDSQEKRVNGKTEVDYVSAIIIHRKGKGARYFWKKIRKSGKKPQLRDKIYPYA